MLWNHILMDLLLRNIQDHCTTNKVTKFMIMSISIKYFGLLNHVLIPLLHPDTNRDESYTSCHKEPRMAPCQCSHENCYCRWTLSKVIPHPKHPGSLICMSSTNLLTTESSSQIGHRSEGDKLNSWWACYP